jgi:hypothetical protein
MVIDGGEGIVGQPAVELVFGLFAGQYLEPDDPAARAVRPPNRLIEYVLGRPPDVGAGAVAFDEGNDRLGRHLEMSLAHDDGLSPCGGLEIPIHGRGGN